MSVVVVLIFGVVLGFACQSPVYGRQLVGDEVQLRGVDDLHLLQVHHDDGLLSRVGDIGNSVDDLDRRPGLLPLVGFGPFVNDLEGLYVVSGFWIEHVKLTVLSKNQGLCFGAAGQ